MNAVTQFNGLNGAVATREELQQLAQLAQEQEQPHVAARIAHVLSKFDHDRFEIELLRPEIEALPQSLCALIDECPDNIPDEDFTGLNKAVSPNEIYQMITDKMINFINEATGKGYKKKWKGKTYGTGYLIPFNFVSKKRYRGVNNWLLRDFVEPLKNPFFLTFKQIEKLGGKLKKGSIGYKVVYYTRLYTYSQSEPKLNFATYDKKKFEKWFAENKHQIPKKEHEKNHFIPILKYYNVFNGHDIEGIDFDLKNFKTGYINKPLPPNQKLPIADAIVEAFPDPKPQLRHGGDRAYYSTGDYIQMPYKADFDTLQDYYRTLYHELGHSTGSYKRLDRDMTGRFGSKKYAFEELIAEFIATFVSAEAGFLWHTNKNHAEYIKNWNNALTYIKDDNRFVMRAASEAQRAADYILQPDADGNPAYLKKLKAAPVEKVESPLVEKRVKELLIEYYEKDKAPKEKFVRHGLTKKSAEIELKKRGGKKSGFEIKPDENEKGRFKIVHTVPGDAAGVNFEEYSRKYRKDFIILAKNQLEAEAKKGSSAKKAKKTEKKETEKPKPKVAKKGATPKVLGYMLVDNISAKTVATKKTLPELKKVFFDIAKDDFEKYDLKPLVYEIVKKGKKNVPGKKLDVDWHKELAKKASTPKKEKPTTKAKKEAKPKKTTTNPKGFAKKPKSVAIATVLKEILNLPKYKGKINQRQAAILYKYFNDNPIADNLIKIKDSDYERGILKKESATHTFYEHNDHVELTDFGAELIKSINGRRESLLNQKHNLALFEGLKGEAKQPIIPITPETTPPQEKVRGEADKIAADTPVTNNKVRNVATKQSAKTKSEFYKVGGQEGKFLQAVEKKPTHSVVITIDGEQGAGKTTTLYKFMNAFGEAQNRSIFFSLEEHPDSSLAIEKEQKYLSKKAQPFIDTVGDLDNANEFYSLVAQYHIIFIDSWQKLIRMIGNIRLDEDLRKKYDGKVFVIIFQQTTTGRTKGGSEVVFDGDMIMKMVKGDSFSENYAYWDKNRYTSEPLENLRYNIAGGYVYNPNQPTDVSDVDFTEPTDQPQDVESYCLDDL